MNKIIFQVAALAIAITLSTSSNDLKSQDFETPGSEHFQISHFAPKFPDANASKLRGMLDIPINKSTGVADVTIPLTSITVDGLTLPIGLSYTSGSGVGAREEAGSVGLGWSLSAGGMITVSVNGTFDLGRRGIMTNLNMINQLKQIQGNWNISSGGSKPAGYNTVYQIAGANSLGLDLEPDRFSFSVAGAINGAFCRDYENGGEPLMIPKSDVKVSPHGVNGFKIVDTQGNSYFFGNAEFISYGNGTQTIHDATNVYYYLYKVETFNGKEILFKYHDYWYRSHDIYNRGRYIESNAHGGTSVRNQNSPRPSREVYGKVLTEIEYPNGVIEFKQISDPGKTGYIRQDYAIGGPPAVDKILHKSKDLSETYECWEFNYAYFNPADDYKKKRLRLEEIILNCSAINSERYVFEYETSIDLPNKATNAMDHWGYFNGKNQSTLIPSFTPMNSPLVDGADRSPDPNYTQAGILKKITYPTGSSTNFEYEQNYIHDPGNAPSVPKNIGLDLVRWSFNQNGPNPTKTFTIDHRQTISYRLLVRALKGFGPNGTYCSGNDPANGGAVIKGVGSSFSKALNHGTGHQLLLQPGTYEVEVWADHCSATHLTLEYRELGVYREHRMVGGVRIKSITHINDLDLTKNMKTSYFYSDFDDVNKSSGVLISGNLENNYDFMSTYQQGTGSNAYTVTAYTLSAAHIPTPIPSVSYRNVTEEIQGKGKTEYTFAITTDVDNFSGMPMTSRAYKRSLLTRVEQLNEDGTILNRKQISYRYANKEAIKGYKVRITRGPTFSCNWNGCIVTSWGNFSMRNFEIESEFVSKKSETITTYDQDGNPLNQSVEYFYDDSNPMRHHQVIKTRTSRSFSAFMLGMDEVNETELTYAQDYQINGILNSGSPIQAKAIEYLTQKNIYEPIEQIQALSNRNLFGVYITSIVKAQVVEYKKFFTRYLPYKSYVLENNQPIASTNFTKSSLDASNNFIKDSRYVERERFNHYDSEGKLLDFTSAQGQDQAFYRAYNNENLIAISMNSTYSESAHTSFESELEERWRLKSYNFFDSDAFTGTSSRRVTRDISGQRFGPEVFLAEIDQNKKYKISAWVKTDPGFGNNKGRIKMCTFDINGIGNSYPFFNVNTIPGVSRELTFSFGDSDGEWMYVEGIIDLPTAPPGVEWGINAFFANDDISKDYLVDEIRIHPIDAQMETFTYKLPYGLSSKCDVRGQRITYEYDNFGRLSLSRDHEGNILQQTDYHYKN